MPSDKKLRQQMSALRKADADAEKLRVCVIAAELRKQEERLKKVAALTDSQKEGMRTAFNEKFAASSTGGFITSEGLAAKALELGVIFNDTQISDLMAVFDTDKDGKLSEEEFAVWWTCGWSSLHQAFRQEELKEEMDMLCAANTSDLPQWSPMLNFEVDTTVGNIPADFKPKASVMAVATPSDRAQYEEGLAANLKLMLQTNDDSDDEDENPPVADAKKTPVMIQVYAGVKDGASEESVENCLEVLKAVLEEHSEQKDIPAAAKLRLMTNEQGKKMFHLTLYTRTDKMSEKDLKQMSSDGGPMGALFMYSQLMDHEAAQTDGFDHLHAGLDFGLDPAEVLSLGSNIPLLGLAEQLRLVVEGSVTEQAIQMANFLVCKEFIESQGGDLTTKRRTNTLLKKLLPNGGVRNVKLSTGFDSPKQVLDAAFATLQSVPVTLAKEQYPDMSAKQLEALEQECADMTRALKATLQAKAPTDGTIKAMTATPALRKFVNTPKNLPKVALISAKDVDVNGALQSLVSSSVSHLDNVPISVHIAGSAKNRYLVADIASESQNLIAGFSATAIISVIDTTSVETIQQGFDALLMCSRFTENATLYASAASAPSPKDDEKYSHIQCVSFADLPVKVSAATAKKDDGSDGDSDDSDADSEEGGAELIKQILSAVGKAMGTLDDVHVSTAVADLHLNFDNFNINALLPATTDELGLVRAQGKVVYQAVAQSAEISMHQLTLDRINDIIERWHDDADDSSGGDSSDDDSEKEATKKKPEWSETYDFSRQPAPPKGNKKSAAASPAVKRRSSCSSASSASSAATSVASDASVKSGRNERIAASSDGNGSDKDSSCCSSAC